MLKAPLDLQCQYAYKTCTNPRTQKKDGDIHKLCALHRDKANSVQKIYAAKRRARVREQRKQHVMQSKALSTQPLVQDQTSPKHATATPCIHTSLGSFDVFMAEPAIEPIQSPSDRRSFSIEEYEFLRHVLLSNHKN